MSFLFGKKEPKFGNPTNDECAMYKENLEFVISNLKFSIVHHDARVDGTMMKAWEEEKKIIEGQLSILKDYQDPRSKK
jgi:hypothetical protein